ncbi:aa3-type cytochrome c oxidase subunit IV [Sphingomonas changnyeongensis]|uniref:Aa3-type cytochrome c oxidase subunit IV n=1 Tax=Sphingomonas changnyeongensis TaxID=2698679 RepID=A0A7Z2S8W8_9SPHN|nr:aa3-type cytochrome c oxidase subunit IV [Sphingomonas changnyeongensis]QHL91122.1 aa3-type cytochrome c oxidase subunit IV [Sphingomonas changnyeongensis]
MAINGDIHAQQKTYSGFIGMVKWGSVLVAIVTAVVVGLVAG